MIKTVILDFDGTIADTRGIILKTMRQTIDRMGYAQPDTERHEWYGPALPRKRTDISYTQKRR